MELIYIFFVTLFLGTSLMIFLQNNPVYSIIYLILSFCCSAFLLFTIGASLFGILFILIYVGAIAVLFLFVVMMVDIKKQQLSIFSANFATYIIFLMILNLLYFSFIDRITTAYFITFTPTVNNAYLNLVEFFQTNLFTTLIDSLEEMQFVGQTLFNEFGAIVYLAGFMLFVSMLVSICLTLEAKQNFYEASKTAQRQLSRNAHKFF